jgi:RNA polymerase sigma-70 factor (ECF subfamily)
MRTLVSAVGSDQTAAVPQPRPVGVDDQIRNAIAGGALRRALELLMRAYQDRVYGHCARMLRDDALAEDVTQQAFEQAYAALSSYRGESSLCGWLLGIASHRCFDALKATRRRARRFAPEEDAPVATSKRPGADDQLDAHLVAAVLDECLGKLAEHTRAAVLLHYREGLTFEAMARILDEKPGTLQARVARAMPVLRACVLGRGIAP